MRRLQRLEVNICTSLASSSEGSSDKRNLCVCTKL